MNSLLQLMARIIEKMPIFEEDMLTQDRPLSFFALLCRDYSQNKWDMIVAAPWIDKNKRSAITFLADQLNIHLNSEEILAISRIVTVDSSDPRLEEYNIKFLSAPDINGAVIVNSYSFFGLDIATAVLFRVSKRFRHTSHRET